MNNTIDTTVSYDTIKTNAETAVVKAGHQLLDATKLVGLHRAALIFCHPKFDKDDYAELMKDSYTKVVEWLQKSGMAKSQARNFANNANQPTKLALNVLQDGLKESVYNAVPNNQCGQAAKLITDGETSVDDFNKIKPSKSGRIASKAKAKLGLTDPKVTKSEVAAGKQCLGLISKVEKTLPKLTKAEVAEVHKAVIQLLGEFE